MRIRAATPGDQPFIDSLRPRLAEHVPAWWDRETALARMQTLVGETLAHPPADAFLAIAEDEGKPSGFLYAVTRSDPVMQHSYAYVLEVVVAEDRRGAGRALFNALESWAREAGLARISLAVLTQNPARGFYERLDFGIDAITMTKLL